MKVLSLRAQIRAQTVMKMGRSIKLPDGKLYDPETQCRSKNCKGAKGKSLCDKCGEYIYFMAHGKHEKVYVKPAPSQPKCGEPEYVAQQFNPTKNGITCIGSDMRTLLRIPTNTGGSFEWDYNQQSHKTPIIIRSSPMYKAKTGLAQYNRY